MTNAGNIIVAAVAVLTILIIITLWSLVGIKADLRDMKQDFQLQIDDLKDRYEKLEYRVSRLETPAYVEKFINEQTD